MLRAALASGDHPTAEQIFETVRRDLPRISLGTVYRNLQRLVAEGRLALAPVDDRSARFDPTLAPHDHFVCEGCGRIFDVAREPLEQEILQQRLQRRGFEIRAHTLSIYGRCPDCRESSRLRPDRLDREHPSREAR